MEAAFIFLLYAMGYTLLLVSGVVFVFACVLGYLVLDEYLFGAREHEKPKS